jgi:hypothetical protein
VSRGPHSRRPALSRGPALSRRTVLRGLAGGATVGLALPTLEAMLPRTAHADDDVLGSIFGVFFWANGLPWHAGHGEGQAGMPDHWTPVATGAGFTPSALQAALARHPYSVVTGLQPWTDIPTSPDGQGDGHMRGFMVALTSDRPRSEGFDHPTHTLTALRPSLDQVVARDARFVGERPTRYRSLELGVSTSRFHDYGHWNGVSYNGPDAINPPVMDPGQLYDRLFSAPSGDAEAGRRAQLLDAVMDDAASLRQRLGAADKARLEAHLEHLFEVQRRLQLDDIACDDPGRPASIGDLYGQTGVMADLLATGLACNLTRVFSFMLTAPATTHIFSEVGVVTDMHTVCHAGHWESVYAITALQMECFGRFLDALAGAVDPLGNSLLDRALVLGTSEYGEGYQHGVAEMPVVLAGRASGRLQTGVHVRSPGDNLARAHLTLMRGLGLDTPTFGFSGSETSDAFDDLLV